MSRLLRQVYKAKVNKMVSADVKRVNKSWVLCSCYVFTLFAVEAKILSGMAGVAGTTAGHCEANPGNHLGTRPSRSHDTLSGLLALKRRSRWNPRAPSSFYTIPDRGRTEGITRYMTGYNQAC